MMLFFLMYGFELIIKRMSLVYSPSLSEPDFIFFRKSSATDSHIIFRSRSLSLILSRKSIGYGSLTPKVIIFLGSPLSWNSVYLSLFRLYLSGIKKWYDFISIDLSLSLLEQKKTLGNLNTFLRFWPSIWFNSGSSFASSTSTTTSSTLGNSPNSLV